MSISDNHTPNHSLEIAPHRFAIGQIVRLTNRVGVWPKTDEVYRITATLPARDDALQYRIRSDNERHERVATEDNLELVRASPGAQGAVFSSWTAGPVAERPASVAIGQKRGNR